MVLNALISCNNASLQIAFIVKTYAYLRQVLSTTQSTHTHIEILKNVILRVNFLEGSRELCYKLYTLVDQCKA